MDDPPSHLSQSIESAVHSPFADEAAAPREGSRGKRSLSFWLAIVFGLVLAVGVALIVGSQLAKDRYRTLEAFPVDKYLDGYEATNGAKFKADLRVEADLGWKGDVGRLLVFSVENNSHSIVVLFPAGISDTVFSKGQRYLVELEVGDGGLIKANSYVKK